MEPGTLKGVGQAQGGELEPAQETASIPNVNGLSGVGADAPPEELIGSTAPRPTMSRRDVYAQPMRAGRPLSTGPMTRFTTWLKMTLSSELQRREWSVDEQLAHAPNMTRPNTVAVISPKGGVGKTTISFVLGNLLADSTRSTRRPSSTRTSPASPPAFTCSARRPTPRSWRRLRPGSTAG